MRLPVSVAALLWLTASAPAQFGPATGTPNAFVGGAAPNQQQSYGLFGPSSAYWDFRRPVTIDNTGNASTLANYQVKITLSSGIFDFGLTNANGNDIRFTDSDGLTGLSYWIEAFDAVGQTGTLWVNVPSIAGSATKTIYIYYGRPGAFAGSNGSATFNFFDGFDPLPSAWVDNASNPVLSPTLGFEGTFVRDPFVMVENGTCEMWYWGDASNLGYATTAATATGCDDAHWTKINQLNVSGLRPSVVKKGSTYYLFTNDPTATTIQVATASSPGGPYSGQTTILSASVAWENGVLNVPSVIFDTDDNTWKMWYSAGTFTPPGVSYTEPLEIGYATNSNSDPSSGWVKNAGNPIIVPSGNGWFQLAVQTMRVAKLAGTYYATVTGADVWGAARIGFIQSQSPSAWTLTEDKLIQNTGPFPSWDQDFVYGGNPINVGGTWSMYFNGRVNSTNTEKIGQAQLNTGIVANQLDTAKWTTSREAVVTVDTTASLANLNGGGISPPDEWMFSHFKTANGINEARTRIKSTSSGAFTLSDLGGRFNGVYYDPLNASFGAVTEYEHIIGAGSSLANKMNTAKFVSGTETSLNSSTQTITKDVWYIQGQYSSGTTIKSYLNYSQIFSGTDSAIAASGYVSLRAFQAMVDIDWVRSRQYTSPEPTTSVGSRQAVNAALQ